MKKVLLSISAAVLLAGTASAQEESRTIGTTAKSGQNILPSAGDIAIGFDASPLFRYVGNIFSDQNNNEPELQGSQGALFGKYFLTDKSAVRARLSFDFDTYKEKDQVQDLSSTDPLAKVFDSYTEKDNYFEIALGYELRRGYGRLQGYYGGEMSVGFGNYSETSEYGNALTTNNNNWGNTRTLEYKGSKNTTFGLGAFAGIEYFVAPKISLGGELGLGLYTNTEKGGKSKTEKWDFNNSSIVITEEDYSKEKTNNNNFTSNTYGRINLTFHF